MRGNGMTEPELAAFLCASYRRMSRKKRERGKVAAYLGHVCEQASNNQTLTLQQVPTPASLP